LSTTTRKRLPAAERRELIELAATEVFAEHGYQRASIDEIARRSGVSAPVVYDHFESKRHLHARLIERHLAEMRAVWGDQLAGDEPPEVRVPRAIDAWFAYVEAHPYAWRMLFADTTGDPEVRELHRAIQDGSRAALVPLLERVPGALEIAGAEDGVGAEMAVEVLRAAIAGLAMWWLHHREVRREQVVAAAVNALWLGLERLAAGERWPAVQDGTV
jgi:AcrR family transcriptional regulator